MRDVCRICEVGAPPQSRSRFARDDIAMLVSADSVNIGRFSAQGADAEHAADGEIETPTLIFSFEVICFAAFYDHFLGAFFPDRPLAAVGIIAAVA